MDYTAAERQKRRHDKLKAEGKKRLQIWLSAEAAEGLELATKGRALSQQEVIEKWCLAYRERHASAAAHISTQPTSTGD